LIGSAESVALFGSAESVALIGSAESVTSFGSAEVLRRSAPRKPYVDRLRDECASAGYPFG